MKVIVDYFAVSPTEKRAGILFLPDGPCKVIYFGHGTGEAAPGINLDTVSKLYNNGSPLYQAQQGLLNAIVSPVSGKTYQPAVFALQGLSQANGDYPWCVFSYQVAYAIKQLPARFPQIDITGILAMGLSAGAQNTFEMLAGPDAGMYAAGVPMSSPAPQMNIMDLTKQVAKVWAFHGTSDTAPLTNFQNSINMVNAINAVKPGYAFYMGYACGHGCWDAEFNPSNRKPFAFAWDGKTVTTKNINPYEFWLACLESNFLFATSGTGTIPAPQPTPVSGTLKAVPVIIVGASDVTLDSSSSTGSVASCNWYVTTDKGAYFSLSGIGLRPSDRKVVVQLKDIKAGNYIARLDLQSADGSKSSVSQNFTVGAPTPPAGPIFPIVIPFNGFTFTLTADKTFTYQ